MRSIPLKAKLSTVPKDRVKPVATADTKRRSLNYSLTVYDERHTYSVDMRANGNEVTKISALMCNIGMYLSLV